MAGIGDWTTERLSRFIQSSMHSIQLPRSVEVEHVTATVKLEVERELVLSPEAITYLKKQLGL